MFDQLREKMNRELDDAQWARLVSPKPSRPILVAANILVTRDRRTILGRRTDCGLWVFPGGKVEDETLLDAAYREMVEESGVKLVGPARPLGYIELVSSMSLANDGKRFVVIAFIWNDYEGEPYVTEPDQFHEMRWFSLDDLPPLEQCSQSTRYFISELLPQII